MHDFERVKKTTNYLEAGGEWFAQMNFQSLGFRKPAPYMLFTWAWEATQALRSMQVAAAAAHPGTGELGGGPYLISISCYAISISTLGLYLASCFILCCHHVTAGAAAAALLMLHGNNCQGHKHVAISLCPLQSAAAFINLFWCMLACSRCC